MTTLYHSTNEPAPENMFVLEVFESDKDSRVIGNRWFHLRINLTAAAEFERNLGHHVTAYYVDKDTMIDVTL